MKVKKDKTSTKLESTENGTSKKEKTMKTTKKPKPATEEVEAKKPQEQTTEKSLKNVDNSVFQYFKELTNEEEQTRMDAALHLLQQLSKTKDEDKRKVELSYTLKRLIRGCGASTNASRAGFFTGLVAFLKAFDVTEISMEQVFETMQKELHVGATISNKEDADAVVGKILTCGALLHAGRTAEATTEHLEQITNLLLQATKHRTYHSSLAYSFLIELLETLTQKQFEASVWPLLHQELVKPWPKQTLQTVHCLIAVHRKYPTVITAKFLKAHFGGPELLNPESYQYLHKIFWENSNTNILTHPAFELFGAYVANSSKLSEFWTETVDPSLQTPTKLLEIESLKIATDILNNISNAKTNIVELLSPNFMRMFVEGLKNLKQKKDETLKAFYSEYLEALVNYSSKKLSTEEQKVNIIRRLIMPPGAFNIEKYTNTRIIHQLINDLGEEGVTSIFELYKSIFLGTLPKNIENSSETWLNFERQNAGYMLQHLLAHKAVAQAYTWREEQLRFFLTGGVFYVNDAGTDICKKEACTGTFSKDFGEQCKNMFYSSLQSKLTDLEKERNLLFQLAKFCNEKMHQKQAAKYFKVKNFDEKLQAAWKSMYDVVAEGNATSGDKQKKKKNKSNETATENDKLQLVFHILLLNMGLQLFREPEMAIAAIDDLLKCMQRTKDQKKKGKQAKNSKSSEEDAEPEWIEVLVDLFLHLLSQNASALRNIVNALFPHLCGNLNLSSVHQILAMLDMKDGQNPLSTKGEESEDEEEVDENEKENVDSDDSDAEDGDDNEGNAEEDEDDDEEEEDEDDEDDDDEEGITETDKLRNAISQALIETGGAVGHDDDMDSVDLNEMTEEEGKKLDEALANAFKAMKKTSSSAQSKKSKSYRVQTTTVMHFRIRVLDLIEIYLQQNPTLLISIEIMLALYDMLPYCVDDELKPLQSKIEKVLTKLTSLKSYTPDSDLKEENLVDFIRLVVEKKAPTTAFDLTNKLRNKCIVFLIGNSNKIAGNAKAAKVLALCLDYIEEFVNSRNPTVNITLLSDIVKLRWDGVWTLARTLAQKGISMQTRTFRRIQIYEILSVLYKNHELLKSNEDGTKTKLAKIEKSIGEHIEQLCAAASDATKLSAKEYQTLLELMMNVQRAHAKLGIQSSLTSTTTCDLLQDLRRKIKLDSTQMYQRFCGAFKLPVIRNNEVNVAENGHANGASAMDVDEEVESASPATDKSVKRPKGKETKPNADDEESQSQAQKRKKAEKDVRKEKKLRKEQRMEAASRGLNGGFAFAQGTEDSDED